MHQQPTEISVEEWQHLLTSTEPARSGALMDVQIVTRNRAVSLARCLASLQRWNERIGQVLVGDDGGGDVTALLRVVKESPLAARTTLIHSPVARGTCACRNKLMAHAGAEWVLQLDDDACLPDDLGYPVTFQAVLQDRLVAAVGFSTRLESGGPHPAWMQPAPVDYPCLLKAFIGCGAVLRRDVFLQIGGYRELMQYLGEERDYCLRLWNSGHLIVYLPDMAVIHGADPSGRDHTRFLRLTARNGLLFSWWNDPWPLLALRVPLGLWRSWGRPDADSGAGGSILSWVIKDLWACRKVWWRERHPVRWRTIKLWWSKLRRCPRYALPVTGL